jgi:hypothetical protein
MRFPSVLLKLFVLRFSSGPKEWIAYPEVDCFIAPMFGPREPIGSKVEPLNEKIDDFLAQYRKEEMVAITLGLAPVESECFRLWEMVLFRGCRRMTLTGKKAPELSTEQVGLAGV